MRGQDDGTGALLREAEAQQRKSCDTDVGGCGALNSVNHFLQHAPRVFTLQVAWESHNEPLEAIATTLAALDEEVGLCGKEACSNCIAVCLLCPPWKPCRVENC